MAHFLNSGRIAVAKSVMARTIHVAWGAGNVAWDDAPYAGGVTETALVSEVGRKLVTLPQYATPDVDGPIVVPGGKFSVSATPTNHLYVAVTFDPSDSPNTQIREVAVFCGGQTNPALPPGQTYFLAADVVSPGDMMVLENLPRITHTLSGKQSFKFVISF